MIKLMFVRTLFLILLTSAVGIQSYLTFKVGLGCILLFCIIFFAFPFFP